MGRLVFVLFASVIALAVSPARPARACSAFPACSAPGGTLPGDGAVDVPLNVELEAFISRLSATPARALVLRIADTSEEVALVPGRTPGRMRAETPLAPSTRYELLAPREIAASGVGTCDEELEVRATFTTGTAVDETAPTSLAASGGGCTVDVCVGGSCCGPYVAALSSASWSATDDGALPVAYAFGSPEGPRTFAGSGGAAYLVTGMFIGGGAIASRGGSLAGASPVYAIDAAGNVSATSASFAFDFSCAPAREEAEMRLRCDGGLCGAPDADTSTSSTAGCAVAGASSGTRSPCAIAAGVVIAFAARRGLGARRPRSRAGDRSASG